MAHTHLCQSCASRYDCHGELERNDDGWPDPVCVMMKDFGPRRCQFCEQEHYAACLRDYAAQERDALLDALGGCTCSTCAHYDGDGFCALPEDDKAISGYISEPASVVCDRWTKPDREAE